MGTQELLEQMKRGAGWVAAAATIGASAMGVAGCGGSSGSSGDAGAASTAPSGGTASASSGAYVAQAKKISEDAQRGLVYSPTDEFTPAADLKLMTSWLGPSQTPPLPKGKSIAFVS